MWRAVCFAASMTLNIEKAMTRWGKISQIRICLELPVYLSYQTPVNTSPVSAGVLWAALLKGQVFLWFLLWCSAQ